jgi:hypothetical protein
MLITERVLGVILRVAIVAVLGGSILLPLMFLR